MKRSTAANALADSHCMKKARPVLRTGFFITISAVVSCSDNSPNQRLMEMVVRNKKSFETPI